jgi:hypothetical protein
VERLVANLVDNALRHNEAGGRLAVVTEARPGFAMLRVTNTGPVVPPDAVLGPFEPFARLGAGQIDHAVASAWACRSSTHGQCPWCGHHRRGTGRRAGSTSKSHSWPVRRSDAVERASALDFVG